MNMQKSLSSLFAAACCLAVIGACTPATTPDTDAGPDTETDAGTNTGTDAGTGTTLRAEGDTCTPGGATQCETGLICLPGQLNPSVGVCRVDCAADQSVCSGGKSCQDVLSASLEYLGSACIPQQAQRDGACQAWTDPDACADGMSCHLTSFEEDAAGNPVTGFNCKVTCDVDGTNTCGADEQCFSSSYIQEFQVAEGDLTGALVSCDLAACESGGSCACDTASGFECREFADATTGCVKVPGECGTPVPPTQAANLVPGGITADLVCNTVEGHAFCDTSMVNEESTSLCLTGIFGASAPNDGICFAFCGSPTADFDGDGAIGEDEAAETFDCAAGWTCTDSFARELGVGVTIPEGDSDKTCDPVACPPGQTCDACSIGGQGDYQCVTFGEGATAQSVCFAPYRACEPVAAQ
ncbi:MAG: hypothetical protein ACO3JL_19260 [Myxococcota bacterium]